VSCAVLPYAIKYSVYQSTSDKLAEADNGYQNKSSRLQIICVDLNRRLKLRPQTDRLHMSVHLLVAPSVRLAIPFLLTTFASNACLRLADLRQNCRHTVGSRVGRYPDLPQDSLRSLSTVSAYSTPVWRGNCVASNTSVLKCQCHCFPGHGTCQGRAGICSFYMRQSHRAWVSDKRNTSPSVRWPRCDYVWEMKAHANPEF